MSVLNVLNFTF